MYLKTTGVPLISYAYKLVEHQSMKQENLRDYIAIEIHVRMETVWQKNVSCFIIIITLQHRSRGLCVILCSFEKTMRTNVLYI